MLPSRGLLRASPAVGLRRTISPGVSRPVASDQLGRVGASRQFGTSLRGNGAISSSIASGGISGGRRIAGLAPIAGVFASRQARHASTQSGLPNPPTSSPTEAFPADVPSTPLELDGSSLLDMPEQIGYLHAMGLDYGWGPTACMQWLLEHVHVYSGLPWWGSIAVVAVLVRVAIFKPSLTAAEHSAKLTELRKNSRYNEILAKMQEAAMAAGKNPEATRLRNEWGMMHKAAGVQIWRTFVPMINLPIGLGMFRLLRGMCALPVPGLEQGGVLWFPDLTVPDPFFILPFASAGIMFYIFKANLPFTPPQTRPIMKLVAYILTPISVVVTLGFPSSLQMFFVVSALLHLIQSWLFKQPWLRRWANLGPLPNLAGPGPSPLPRAPAGTWVAPRTISTTARPAVPAEADDKLTITGVASGLQDGWKSAKSKMNNYSEKKVKQSSRQKAEEYEQRRSLEEKEKYFGRKDQWERGGKK